MKIKIIIDFIMTIFLLMLMGYQITGEKFHELFGTGMIILFIVHNILNIRWYSNLFKGKYNALRILRTGINFAVLVAILSLAYSGIVMSRYVFSSLPINSGMALARVIHLSASYWGFVLMNIHLGLHWGMVVGIFNKLLKGRKVFIMEIIAIITAVYGAFCFYQLNILSYMFLKVEFVFFDFEKSAFSVFLELISMMELWVFIGYYTAKGIGKISSIKKRGENL